MSATNEIAPTEARTGVAARAVGLTKTYGERDATVRALDDVSVEFERARFSAIMGPSGSGKSTLLHCMAGLDKPTSGQVLIGDVDLTTLSEKDLTLLRRKSVGFVFQAYNLVPTLTASENITLPLDIAGDDAGRGLVRRGGRHRRDPRPPVAIGRPSSPGASSSGSPARERSSAVPRSCSPTSRRATWTRRRATRS